MNILGLTRQHKIAWKSGRKFISKLSPQADFNFVQPCCTFSLNYVIIWLYRLVIYIYIYTHTMWWSYNAVDFLQNTHSRHPIAHLWRQAIMCLLWVQKFLQCYKVALDISRSDIDFPEISRITWQVRTLLYSYCTRPCYISTWLCIGYMNWLYIHIYWLYTCMYIGYVLSNLWYKSHLSKQ